MDSIKFSHQDHNPITHILSFFDLPITSGMIERTIGYQPGKVPDRIAILIDEVLSEAGPYFQIDCGLKFLGELKTGKDNLTLHFGGKNFSTGKIITPQLKRATEVAAYVCTAGQAVSAWISDLLAHGQGAKGYIADLTASHTVEQAMTRFQDLLAKDLASQGLGITNRFSPGYCRWPVKEQHELFSLLPKDFCGISLTPSAMMKPVKSTSGIIGIGQQARQNKYHCNSCDDETCYRKQGAFL